MIAARLLDPIRRAVTGAVLAFVCLVVGLPSASGSPEIPISSIPTATEFRMPFGVDVGPEDLGADLKLLTIDSFAACRSDSPVNTCIPAFDAPSDDPKHLYPRIRFNDMGHGPTANNQWYVVTAFNERKSLWLSDAWETNKVEEYSDAHLRTRHPGEDWNLSRGAKEDKGKPVFAVAPGKVVASGCTSNYGNAILIVHRTEQGTIFGSLYGHLAERFKQVGDEIKAGELSTPIGSIGGTGGVGGSVDCQPDATVYPPHLHFEIRKASFFRRTADAVTIAIPSEMAGALQNFTGYDLTPLDMWPNTLVAGPRIEKKPEYTPDETTRIKSFIDQHYENPSAFLLQQRIAQLTKQDADYVGPNTPVATSVQSPRRIFNVLQHNELSGAAADIAFSVRERLKQAKNSIAGGAHALANRLADRLDQLLSARKLADDNASVALVDLLSPNATETLYDRSKFLFITSTSLAGGPVAPKVAAIEELLFLPLDYGIDSLLFGNARASSNLRDGLRDAAVDAVLKFVPVPELGNVTFDAWLRRGVAHQVGASETYTAMSSVLQRPETKAKLKQGLAKLAASAASWGTAEGLNFAAQMTQEGIDALAEALIQATFRAIPATSAPTVPAIFPGVTSAGVDPSLRTIDVVLPRVVAPAQLASMALVGVDGRTLSGAVSIQDGQRASIHLNEELRPDTLYGLANVPGLDRDRSPWAFSTQSLALKIGDAVEVSNTGGVGLRLRTAPGLSASQVQVLPEGTVLAVVGGPMAADGYSWWQVQTQGQIVGWAAVGDWLRGRAGGGLYMGAAVTVAGTGGAGLNLRQGPSLGASAISVLADGSELFILGGPAYSDGYLWWNVAHGTQVGWSAVAYWLSPVGQSTAPSTSFSVTTNVLPAGAGLVTGGGAVAGGARISLVAQPAPGYVFAEWIEGGRSLSLSAQLSLTVTSNRNLTARFVPGAAGVGSVRVSISPDAAGAAGAQWRLVGESAWRPNGSAASNLPLGTYSVEFLPIPGWTTPPPTTDLVISVTNPDIWITGGQYVQIVAPFVAAPSGLLASASPDGSVRLTWTDNSANEGAFLVEQRDTSAGGTYFQRAATGPNIAVADVLGFAPGRTYCYRVRAYDGVGTYSSYSNEACVQPLSVPVNPVCVAPGIAPLSVSGVAAGDNHGLVLRGDGTVWAWGPNARGALGDGTTANALVPTSVAGLQGVVQVAAGSGHSLALKSDGTVWAWGLNDVGQVGDGSKVDRLVPVQVAGLSDIRAIAAHGALSLALGADGAVWSWGANFVGQLGDGGRTNRASPGRVLGLPAVKAIAAGWSHGLAAGVDGSVWIWGGNAAGSLALGAAVPFQLTAFRVSGIAQVNAVAAGDGFSIALRSDGTVWTWGDNIFGQLLPVSPQGTSVSVPRQLTALSGIAAVAAGDVHGLALSSAGQAFTWGNNGSGQLGDGSTKARTGVLSLAGFGNGLAVAGGFRFSIGQSRAGTLCAWGSGEFGQLGDGSTSAHAYPSPVLEVGGAGYFSASADSIPDTLGFEGRVGVPLSVPVVSSPVVLSGLDTGTTIRVTGGEYSVDGAAFTAAPGVVAPGQTVALRVTSANVPDSATAVTVLIGSATGVFSVTTAPDSALARYTLTVNSANGRVSVSPQQPDYPEGTRVRLVASSDVGYGFAAWTGDVTASAASVDVVVSKDTLVTAQFAPLPEGTVITKLGRPFGAVADDSYVYLMDELESGTPRLHRFAKSGGMLEPMGQGADATIGWRRLIPVGDHLYAGLLESRVNYGPAFIISRIPKTGGSFQTLVSQGIEFPEANLMGIYQGRIYYRGVVNNQLYVLRVPLAGGPREPVVPMTGWVRNVTSDESASYFFEWESREVRKFDFVTNTVTTLIPPSVHEGRVFVDNLYVYYSAGGSVRRVSKNGGTVTTVVPGPDASGFASDNTNLYFSEGGQVKYVPVDGGQVGVLASVGAGVVTNILIDSGYVYWTETGSGFGEGRLARAAQPGVAPITYSVAVSSTNGSISVAPQKANYAPGDQITVTATPAAGYAFAGWTGDASGTSNPLTVTVTRNLSIGALFTALPVSTPDGQPTVLATGLNEPAEFRIVGNEILFTDNSPSGGFIKSVTKTGGPANTLVSGAALLDSGAIRGPGPFAVAGDKIYSAYGGYERSNIFSAPATGGAASTLQQISGGQFLGVIGDTLYFSSGFNTIRTLSLSGGPSTVVLSGIWVRGNAMDSSALYFLDFYSKDLRRLDLVTGGVITLIAGDATDGGVALDNTHVYLRNGGLIRRVPKTGGPVATIYSGSGSGQLASDNEFLYFTEGDALNRIPVSGGAVERLSTVAPGGGNSMVVDDAYIYWGEGNVAGASRILRVAKPLPGSTSYSLAVQAVNGSVVPSPAAASYAAGAQVTLTAQPADGYQFLGWSGDASGATNPLVIAMTANKTITALFGPIAAGPLVPTVLASQLAGPAVMRLDSGFVYFADSANDSAVGVGALKRVPTAGGPLETLFSGAQLFDSGRLRGVGSYQVTADSIFGAYGGYVAMNVFRSPKTGGAPSTLVSPSGGEFIGVIDNTLYYAHSFNFIARVPVTGGASTNVLSGNWVRSNRMDNSAIYFVEFFSRDVRRFDLATGGLTTLIGGNTVEGKVAIDATHVYFSAGGTIRRVPKAGGPIEIVYQGTQAQPMVSDGVHVYFVDGTSLKRVPVGGGTATDVLSVASNAISDIAQDASYIYLSDLSAGISAGRILRLAKPAAPAATFTLSTSGTNGTVTRSVDAASYAAGAVVVLTATPAQGYRFSGWAGDATGTQNPLSVSMSGNKTIFATFERLPVAPTISAPPLAQTVIAGTTATMTVLAAGDAPLQYQWLRDGVPVAGANSATLELPAVQAGAGGVYTVLVSNLAGSVTSAGALLTVRLPDTAGPRLTLNAPPNGSVTTSPTVVLVGSASDQGYGGSGIAFVRVNGILVDGVIATGDASASWSSTVALHPGRNDILVSAADGSSAGNVTSQSWMLIYNPVVESTAGDGLPDRWKLDHGFNVAANLAAVDSDGDGFSNLDEYLAGTDPNDALDRPDGVGTVNYVHLRDRFEATDYGDRWQIGATRPFTSYHLSEAGAGLGVVVDQPTEGCTGHELQSFGTIDAVDTVFHLHLTMNGYGTTAFGLLTAADPTSRVFLTLDADGPVFASVVSIDAGVRTDVPVSLPAVPAGEIVSVRLVKTGAVYRLIANGAVRATWSNTGLGDVQLRPYFEFESCVGDQGSLDTTLLLVEGLVDRDADGLPDLLEDINQNGIVDAGETNPLNPNTDSDGVPDGLDNCLLVANASQRDSNGDGFGNNCDADLDNDGMVSDADLAIMKGKMFGTDANADLNGDGLVNFADLAMLKGMLNKKPGPSGLLVPKYQPSGRGAVPAAL